MRKNKPVFTRLAEIGEDPCLDCTHSGRCGSDGLACFAFLYFINEMNGQTARFYRPRRHDKTPTPELYVKAFGEDRP